MFSFFKKEIKPEYNIVVVDDNKFMRESVKMLFKTNYPEFNVKYFKDAYSCLEYINKRTHKKDRIGLAIIDWFLPEMNGDLLSVLIKDSDYEVVSFLYTASDDMLTEYLKAYKFDAMFLKQNGKCVDRMMSQYVDYLDGKIKKEDFVGDITRNLIKKQ